MSSRALVAVLLVAGAACHGRTAPPGRERVLAKIPGDAHVVIASDGRVLSGARLRPVIDVLRPRWPTRFGCVIDAALAGEHVAIGMTTGRDVTVVIATHAAVTCPTLSGLGEGLWTATLGAGKPATGPSVLDADAHARARGYLLNAPLAASIVLPNAKLIGTATGEPLEAWLAIDTLDAASALAEQKVRGVLDRMARADSTASFAQAITISHDATQVIARLTGPVDGDLAVAVRAVLDWYETQGQRPAATFACPALSPPIIGCAAGTQLTATSLVAALGPLAAANVHAIVENERVAFLRLDNPVPSLGLQPGDLLLAIDGRRLTSPTQLDDELANVRRTIAITLSRDGTPATLTLTEARRTE